ncbi:SDR family NAD(P)-dependent oxidoreductase [Chloroflexota bacterium]
MNQQSFGRMTDKVAIVTGAGQWIGRAIALRLAEEGADVVIDDIVVERANKVADEVRALGRKALAVGTDVSNSRDVEEMVKATLEQFGKIDILVNNARAGGLGAEVGKAKDAGKKPIFFAGSTEEHWDHTIAGSLKSVRNCTHAVINHMIERKSGKIINMSSGAGVRGMPGAVAYSTAKAGIIGFTMALSEEVALDGVRVNCISPGPTGAAVPEGPEFMKKMAEMSGVGRAGKPEEVAALVAFLASDEADFISGQNYVMAGMRP